MKLLLLALGLAIAQAAAPTFRADTTMVSIFATVVDRDSRTVPDLRQDNFQLRVDGQLQAIELFSRTPPTLTIVALFQSGYGPPIHGDPPNDQAIMIAGRSLAGALRPGDRVRVGSYGIEVVLSPHLTGDIDLLHRILDEEIWQRRGWNALWGGLHSALSTFDHQATRRVLLVFGDGKNSAWAGQGGWTTSIQRRGSPTSKSVTSLALRQDVSVYAVGLSAGSVGSEMKAIAQATGGTSTDLNASVDLGKAITAIIDDLRHQYLIAFVPTPYDDKEHQIELRVDRPGLSVRARQSFVASADKLK